MVKRWPGVSPGLVPPPAVAAVTLAPEGGGIAAVSRMTWRVLSDRWPDSTLITLVDAAAGPGVPRPGLASRLRFGAGVLRSQLPGGSGWVFFNHLALARAQQFVPKSIRRPTVVFLHGIEAWRPLPAGTRQMLDDAVLRIANSRHTAELASQANPGLGPVEICPLALERDVDEMDQKDEVPGRAGAPTVLMLGRMLAAERYKGHDQMLEAWPAVGVKLPTARLVIAGDGDDRPRLEAKARALGVGDRVEFTGFVPDSARDALYRRAQLFAMPSQGEGFGLVYLEAMAHGLPCLGSTQDAAREVIADGVTGYLMNQTDIGGLSSRVVELLTDEPRRRVMGEAGRTRVASRFTYRHFASRLLTLIDGVSDGWAMTRRSA